MFHPYRTTIVDGKTTGHHKLKHLHKVYARYPGTESEREGSGVTCEDETDSEDDRSSSFPNRNPRKAGQEVNVIGSPTVVVTQRKANLPRSSARARSRQKITRASQGVSKSRVSQTAYSERRLLSRSDLKLLPLSRTPQDGSELKASSTLQPISVCHDLPATKEMSSFIMGGIPPNPYNFSMSPPKTYDGAGTFQEERQMRAASAADEVPEWQEALTSEGDWEKIRKKPRVAVVEIVVRKKPRVAVVEIVVRTRSRKIRDL
ncbi:hypothetical protein LTR66_007689 [Elasticomyces elasticus]|nr:hypothetical protein LTR66_007689 [Elasticomyces elasticus]